MFCINCGTKLPDDAKFCYNCGKKLDVKLSPAEPQVLKDEEKSLKEEKVNILNEYPKQEKTVSAKKEKEKTEVGFDIKRFIPIIGVGVIAVIFMVLLFFGWNMIFGKKNIPDPEYYFKNLGTIEFNGNGVYDSHVYTVKTDEDITDAAIEYCDLLTDEYKFTDWYERYSDIDEQGDFKKTFDYDGSRFGHDTSWDIQIEFNGPAIYSTDGSCTLVIKIYNTEKFSLVKNEQQGKVDSTENGKEIKEETETETTGNPFDDALITLPDPEDYFDDIAEVTIEKDGEEIIYTVISDSDTKEATDTYVEFMEKVVDMKLKGSSRLGGYGYTYTYFYSGDDEHFDKSQPAVQIKYESNYDESLNGKYRSVVTLYQSDLIYVSKGVSFKADEAVENTPTPTPTATPTPTPTPEPAAGPEVLPDFTKIAEKYDGELNRKSDENYILYYFGDSIPKTPIDDYIEALEAKGYKVTDSEIGGSRYHDLYEWWLTNSAVDAIDIHGDHKGQVYVKFNDAENYSEVTVEFSNGIKMEGYKDEPYPSVDPDDFWEDCPNCINGVCSNCGGSGKDSKFQAGLGWVEQDCLSCRDGECKYCDGDGYLGH